MFVGPSGVPSRRTMRTAQLVRLYVYSSEQRNDVYPSIVNVDLTLIHKSAVHN